MVIESCCRNQAPRNYEMTVTYKGSFTLGHSLNSPYIQERKGE